MSSWRRKKPPSCVPPLLISSHGSSLLQLIWENGGRISAISRLGIVFSSPTTFGRSFGRSRRSSSCYRPSPLICPSVSLSLGVEWSEWISLSLESRYGNLCPAHAHCPGSSPLLSLSISSPHSDPNEGTKEQGGQHRNQRERWITSAKNAVPKQCPNGQTPDTVDKGHYTAATAGFMVRRASCIWQSGRFLLRDSGNPKKESCEKFSAEEKRLIGHSGQLRSGIHNGP